MRRGIVGSREAARQLVARGAVLVSGAVADKPSRLVSGADALVVRQARPPFASRGGEKLDAALTRFAVDVAGRRCLDAGASTGGFTDCLLRRGAASVLAVDVGYGQLALSVRGDPRVEVLERTNVRALRVEDVGGAFDVVVADLSFISLVTVSPLLLGDLARPGADVVALVKPQFEAGRVEADRGRGVISDPAVRRAAVQGVASAFASQGATIMGVMASPLLGPAGNAEFLLHARAHTRPPATTAGGDPRALEPSVLEPSVLEAVARAVSDAPDAPDALAELDAPDAPDAPVEMDELDTADARDPGRAP